MKFKNSYTTKRVIYQTVVWAPASSGLSPTDKSDSCRGLVFAFFSVFCDFSQNLQFSLKSLKSHNTEKLENTLVPDKSRDFCDFNDFCENCKFYYYLFLFLVKKRAL